MSSYCAHFQIQLKEGEWYRTEYMLIMVMTLDLRVMDFTDLGKVSNVCAM